MEARRPRLRTISPLKGNEMRIASTKLHNNEARKILTREYLEKEYVLNERSACGIAGELGIHQSVVLRQMQSFGVEIRPIGFYHQEKHFGYRSELQFLDVLTPELLQREYVERQRSANDIGKELSICCDSVLEYLKRYGFEIRGKIFYVKGDRHPCKGRRMSDETKRAISKANTGRYDGSNNPFYGRKHTLETRRLISDHHADVSLENHPRWEGGKSFEPYTIEFDRQLKDLIRLRDNYTCQLCGVPEAECYEKLHCHHGDYDKENCLPSNLISLCRRCHTKTNSNREYWTGYFNNKLLITA